VSRKTLTESQKKEILERFQNGSRIKDIAKDFQFTAPTITRQLKKLVGEEEFFRTKKFIINSSSIKNKIEDNTQKVSKEKDINCENHNQDKEYSDKNSFFELVPLDFEIDSAKQKDITSQSINSVELPKVVFMIVDSKVELQPKLLKDYASWSFLPEDDLNRNTIEIFSDQKSAKKYCSQNQKVIKVPNPNVFLIASETLKRKGISRIIFDQLLLSL
tara:strand:- start:305 stop:955 length:651 start_codon:yes stop_codon:yes gene_type:complete